MSMRMTLAAKGRFAPPPVLDAPLQRLSEAVQSWPGIVAATHWHFSGNGHVDGADFYRGQDELGHVHVDGALHLATSPALGRALIGAGLARPFPYADGDVWVLYRVRSTADVRHAEWLLRLAYDQLGGAPEHELLARVARGAGAPRQA